METVIRTARLALRQWTMDDAEPLFAIYGDPRVWQYLPPGGYGDLTDTRARLAAHIDAIATRGFGHWALIENDGGALVGSCGFRGGIEEKDLEVGFTIAPARWGRGYATEIASSAVELGFARFAAPRVWSFTSPANEPSRRVLDKIGMRYVKELVEDGTTWAVYARDAPDAPDAP